jgi:ABC-type transport system substrate-binding protein
MMMKKSGIIVFALVFVAAGVVLASPPVPPPYETNTISSSSDVQCQGNVLGSQKYTNRWIGATDGDPGAQFVGNATVPFKICCLHFYESLPLRAPGSDLAVPVLGAAGTPPAKSATPRNSMPLAA